MRSSHGQILPAEMYEFLEIVFGVLLVLFLGFMAGKLALASLDDPPHPSHGRVNAVHDAIVALEASTVDPAYLAVPFAIDDDSALYAFDSDWDHTINTLDNDPAYKPFECGSAACLVLAQGWDPAEPGSLTGVAAIAREGFGQKNIVFITPDPGVVTVLGNVRDDVDEFFGSVRYAAFGQKTWSKHMYIEKRTIGDTKYYFIAPMDYSEDDPVQQHIKKHDVPWLRTA